MAEIFARIIEMSLYASVVIALTIVIRFFLKKSSKRLMMILWLAVAVRLLVPINVESAVSIFNLFPSTGINRIAADNEAAKMPDERVFAPVFENNNAEVSNATTQKELMVNEDVKEEVSKEPVNVITNKVVDSEVKPAPTISLKNVCAIVWVVGVAVILLDCTYRYVSLKKMVKGAKQIDKDVYVSELVDSPFVMGIVKPRIYLPETLSDSERGYILLHERTHIKRGDYLSKIVGMVACAFHWFNPLVWIAYMLFEQDMEMSCDEKTVEEMGEDIKKAYSLTLVSFATKKESPKYKVVFLGFSKVNFSKAEVTIRVKNILNYKKGSKILAVATAVALLTVSTACSLNATSESKAQDETTQATQTTQETVKEETVAESSESEGNTSSDVANEPLYELAYYTTPGNPYKYAAFSPMMIIEIEGFKMPAIEDLDSNLQDILSSKGYTGEGIISSEDEDFPGYPLYRLGMRSEYVGNAFNDITLDIYKFDSEVEATNELFARYMNVCPEWAEDYEEYNSEEYDYLDKSFSFVAVMDDNGVFGQCIIAQHDEYLFVTSVTRNFAPIFDGSDNDTTLKLDVDTYDAVLKACGIQARADDRFIEIADYKLVEE